MGSIRVRKAAENRDFISLSQVKSALGLSTPTHDERLSFLISAASSLVEEYTDRVFARELITEKIGVDTEIDLGQRTVTSPRRLALKRTPILAIEAIRFDEQDMDLTTFVLEDAQAGFLYSNETFQHTHRSVKILERVRTASLEPLWEVDYSAGYILPTFPKVSFNFATTDVDVTNNTIVEAGDELLNGDTVRLDSDTTLPSPLIARVDYFVRDRVGGVIKLSDDRGGVAIDITDQGTGTHTITRTTTLPKDLQEAVVELVINMFHKGQRESGIASERLGDHAVTYAKESTFSGIPVELERRFDRYKDLV